MKLSKFDTTWDFSFFADMYEQVYDELYDYGEYKDYDYDKALDAGDEILADEYYDEIIDDLVERRGDYFSSDREIAALAICFDIMDLGRAHTQNIKKENLNMKRTDFLNDEAHTALSNWTDEEIEDIIEDYVNPYSRYPHLFYYPADDIIDIDKHFLSHCIYEEDRYYDEYYSVDIFLKEHHLELTVQNIRRAAEEIADGAEAFEDTMKEEE